MRTHIQNAGEASTISDSIQTPLEHCKLHGGSKTVVCALVRVAYANLARDSLARSSHYIRRIFIYSFVVRTINTTVLSVHILHEHTSILDLLLPCVFPDIKAKCIFLHCRKALRCACPGATAIHTTAPSARRILHVPRTPSRTLVLYGDLGSDIFDTGPNLLTWIGR